jgi:hypothetical protein
MCLLRSPGRKPRLRSQAGSLGYVPQAGSLGYVPQAGSLGYVTQAGSLGYGKARPLLQYGIIELPTTQSTLSPQREDLSAMANDKLNDYHTALRTAFYQQRDQELLDYLDGNLGGEHDAGEDPLHSIAGVRDPEVLQALTKLGITPDNVLAFTLLPLVRMAWADSRVQDGEFNAILQAAEAEGMKDGSVSYRLLTRWLEERPSEQMIDAWRSYARALAEELDDATLLAVRHEVLGRAHRIAEVSGGILGFNTISDNERLVLEDLSRALEKSSV